MSDEGGDQQTGYATSKESGLPLPGNPATCHVILKHATEELGTFDLDPSTIMVREFRALVEELSGVAIDEQRLVARGHVISNDDVSLYECKRPLTACFGAPH